jgi:hypothetical protein
MINFDNLLYLQQRQQHVHVEEVCEHRKVLRHNVQYMLEDFLVLHQDVEIVE